MTSTLDKGASKEATEEVEVGVRERDVVILKKKFRFSSITLQPGILGILLGLMGGITRDCVREVSLA